jgi:hypothetical protein
MTMFWSHLVYLAASVAITVGVARTLSRHGRVFLVDVFGGRKPVADAVNSLLVVGFYLVNIAYVALALRFGAPAETFRQAVERVADKVGLVLLILGGMHLFNLMVLTAVSRHYRNRPLDVLEYLD